MVYAEVPVRFLISRHFLLEGVKCQQLAQGAELEEKG